MEKLLEKTSNYMNLLLKVIIGAMVFGSFVLGFIDGGIYQGLLILMQCVFMSIAVSGGAYVVFLIQYKRPKPNMPVLNVVNLIFIFFFFAYTIVFTVMAIVTDVGLNQWFIYIFPIILGALTLIGFRYKYIKNSFD